MGKVTVVPDCPETVPTVKEGVAARAVDTKPAINRERIRVGADLFIFSLSPLLVCDVIDRFKLPKTSRLILLAQGHFSALIGLFISSQVCRSSVTAICRNR